MTDQPLWGATPTPEALGNLVAVLRRRRGLTQADLAERAGAPRRFVGDLEGGHATIYLQRLFDVLDVLDVRLVVEEPGAARGAQGEEAATDEGPGLKDLGW